MKHKPLFVSKKSSKETREENQDSIVYDARNGFFLVADGLGGKNHYQGQLASHIATTLMGQYVKQNNQLLHTKRIRPDEIEKWLRRSIMKTNEALVQLGTTPMFHHTATTLEVSHLYKNILHYAHLGDSATFIIRPYDKQGILQGSIELLAEEQTTTPGVIGGKLEHYLGKQDLEPQNIIIKAIPLQKYDIIFSCTDGVTKPLLPEDLLEIFTNYPMQKTKKEILNRVKQPVYLQQKLKEKELEHTINNYLGDNASYIIYQAGD